MKSSVILFALAMHSDLYQIIFIQIQWILQQLLAIFTRKCSHNDDSLRHKEDNHKIDRVEDCYQNYHSIYNKVGYRSVFSQNEIKGVLSIRYISDG